MPTTNNVDSVLGLARNVRDLCRQGPDEFRAGENAAGAAVDELKTLCDLLNSGNIPSSAAVPDLSPCIRPLERMLDIRRKYGLDGKMKLFESLRWKQSDREQFEKETSVLFQAVTLLRRSIQGLQAKAPTPTPTVTVPANSTEIKVETHVHV